MAKAICMQDNMEFASEAEFEAHKASGHKTVGTPIGPPSIPVVPDAAAPTPEFIETVKRLEAKSDPTLAPDGTKLEIPKPKPIKLTYIYTGDCETCKSPVKTLELDVETRHFVTAYCMNCNKQLESREETKL